MKHRAKAVQFISNTQPCESQIPELLPITALHISNDLYLIFCMSQEDLSGNTARYVICRFTTLGIKP